MLSSLARYCPIHRRTHQRVAELEPIGTHANEVCRLGGDKTTLVDVQLGCGAGNRPPATGALRRGIKSIARTTYLRSPDERPLWSWTLSGDGFEPLGLHRHQLGPMLG